MKKKHYYFSLDIRDATPDGVNVEVTSDMFATKQTAAVIVEQLGKVGKAIMQAEKED